MVIRLCPVPEATFDSLTKSIYTVSDEGKEWEGHSPPFSLGLEIVILPQNEIFGDSSRTDAHLWPAHVPDPDLALAAESYMICFRAERTAQ
jgi:hypothetical protein